MSVVSGIISGFDEGRRKHRDQERERAYAREDREFSILQALATHLDPEIAAIGATALLGLAGGQGPKGKKGLSGFLGEVEGSAALDPVKKFLGAGGGPATGAGPTSAAAVPGSAAQPSTAVVEPERQQRGPGLSAPPAPAVGEGPPGMPLPGAQPGEGGPPTLAGGMATGGPPPPPPPETPQTRMRRLFPSAGDIAEEQAFRGLQGRLQAILQGIQAVGGTKDDALSATLGAVGAPRRATRAVSKLADYVGMDGQEYQRQTVIFNPETTEYTDSSGNPVRVIREWPMTTPRPIRSQVLNPATGLMEDQFRDPNDLAGGPIATVPTNRTPPPAPPAYSSIIQTPEGYVPVFRGGGTGAPIADTLPRAGELSGEQQQATAWLADVQAEIKAALAGVNRNVPSQFRTAALPTAQQNALVQKITQGRYQTIGELTAATKKVAAPQGPGGPAGPAEEDARTRANRLRQRLEQGQPSRVQGSGMPPGM